VFALTSDSGAPSLRPEQRMATAALADACVRLSVPVRLAPAGVVPVAGARRVSGRALPAQHAGSVDVFLEALEAAAEGDVLVIDNAGRQDEGCVGDLTVLEALHAGVVGVVVWGAHRDTEELQRIGLPVYSYGACPAGPRAPRERSPHALDVARLGDVSVYRGDLVSADSDGVIVIRREEAERVMAVAAEIQERERAQVSRLHQGESLRSQLKLATYLERRARDSSYSFRHHLAEISGAIET
jgi:4-hydroxy-4-methyl-2-oxoglutarate aldolase